MKEPGFSIIKLDRYDLISFGMIALILIFSLIRFNYLPQFVDGYYHLSAATGFIKSGGWVGWSWWDYAPLGRPQIYPPLYHFLLAFIQKLGLSGLDSLRITEVLIAPLFFFISWFVLRKLASAWFAFINLLTLSSFFSFYAHSSANVPATIALIFGFLSWYFFKKGKWISASLFLILSFYTHGGIPWIFFISFLSVMLIKKYRLISLKIVLISLTGALPVFFHQFRYLEYLQFHFTGQIYFIHFSIFILVLGCISLFSHRERDLKSSLFLGYLIGSLIIFFKYPYRLLCAQGIIGFVFFSSFLLEKYFEKLNSLPKKTIFILVCIYLLFFHSTIDLSQGKKPEFNLTNSTYFNFLTGNTDRVLEFKSLFWPKYYRSIVEVIRENTGEREIISSNLKIMAQIFSSLTGRVSSNSMLYEVKPQMPALSIYAPARLIVWIKPADKTLVFLKKKLGWVKIYENDIAFVFRNPNAEACVYSIKAKISFKYVYIVLIIFFFIFILDNVKIKKYYGRR